MSGALSLLKLSSAAGPRPLPVGCPAHPTWMSDPLVGNDLEHRRGSLRKNHEHPAARRKRLEAEQLKLDDFTAAVGSTGSAVLRSERTHGKEGM